MVKEKFYRPHSQFAQITGFPIRNMTLVVRTAGDPMSLVSAVRHEVLAMDPNLPIAAIRPMTDVVASAASTPRFTGLLLGLFATLALTLAAIGIYGVLAYLVSQRTREIGIRMAIGADRTAVLGLVVSRGLWLALGGVAVGLAISFVVARFIGSLLYQVRRSIPSRSSPCPRCSRSWRSSPASSRRGGPCRSIRSRRCGRSKLPQRELTPSWCTFSASTRRTGAGTPGSAARPGGRSPSRRRSIARCRSRWSGDSSTSTARRTDRISSSPSMTCRMASPLSCGGAPTARASSSSRSAATSARSSGRWITPVCRPRAATSRASS